MVPPKGKGTKKRTRMSKNKISKYISYEEATKSQAAVRHGIKNDPDNDQLLNMMVVGEKVHTPIREHFKKPIPVSSFFRCEQLNRKIGGAATSQHMTGEAIDIDVDSVSGITNKQVFDFVKENLEFDQLINEFPDHNGNPSWVHVSFKRKGNRKQVLTIKRR
jgi:zinc D-Ala-D-Ala carboxypeptidase